MIDVLVRGERHLFVGFFFVGGGPGHSFKL